jgi:hypothetical protein
MHSIHFIIGCLRLAAALGLLTLAVIAAAETPETFGCESNPTGNPVGGGKGYQRIVTKGDFHVSTADELLAALKQAVSGQVVYLADHAEINLTGRRAIVIPGGVTLASGRERGESKGGLIFTTEDKPTPGERERFHLLETGGPNVRVTGLRLRGPDEKRRGRYEFLNSDGIQSEHTGLEVDNCEIWGWSHGGVCLVTGGRAHVRHNHIHHCQRTGLGYGVVLDQSEALIEANLFDWCRHAIAGTGRPGTSYEARYNLVLPNANGHSFDMHGGADRRDGTQIAGDWMKIHHNTFKATRVPAFVLRGVPRQTAEVYHNWFLHADQAAAVRQHNARGNLKLFRNAYGSEKTVKD